MLDPIQVRHDNTLVVNGGSQPRVTNRPEEDTGIVKTAADRVAAVIESGRTAPWGGGKNSKSLEERFAQHVGRKHALFHSSGTAALHSALFSLGATEGTPTAITNSGFVASINVIYHLRSRPIFLPTDEATLLASEDTIAVDLPTKPELALLTHFFGNVLDVDVIGRNLGGPLTVEDAGQAHGATLRGRPVGSFGRIGSFAGSHKKLITAGQGGLNTFDDEDLLFRMRTFCHHGQGPNDIHFPGFNFRGGEMEAALALAAFDELDERVSQRNATAEAITNVFRSAELNYAQVKDADRTPAWFDVALILDEPWLGHRDWLISALAQENINLWRYPSLISIPWVSSYMKSRRWWGDYEETLEARESAIWDRVIVIPTQITPIEGKALADALVSILCA